MPAAAAAAALNNLPFASLLHQISGSRKRNKAAKASVTVALVPCIVLADKEVTTVLLLLAHQSLSTVLCH
jgi:hypothetical protein